MSEGDAMWSRKGATMSDKSARQEFGLTQQEIITVIRAGKLQYRQSSMHGNPWFRLLRMKAATVVEPTRITRGDIVIGATGSSPLKPCP